MRSLIFGEPKIKPLVVRNPCAIEPEVMVCKKCNQPVYQGFGEYYTCDTCHALTSNVEWQKQRITS